MLICTNCKKPVVDGVVCRGTVFCNEQCAKEFFERFKKDFGYEFSFGDNKDKGVKT